MPIEDALEKIGMVVEGYTTQEAAFELAQKYNVEMPITFTMHRLLHGETEAERMHKYPYGQERKT